MKKLIKISLATSILVHAHADNLNLKTMDTSGLFERTIDAVPECIEYCVDGVSLYMIITPFGITYYWTPNVSHNSPDILMMSHNDSSTTPWADFNRYFGNSYGKLSGAISKTIFSDVKSEVGGGRAIYKKYGKHQALNFKEATAVGHPASMILKMFGNGGLKPKGYWVGSGDNKSWHSCRTNGCVEESSTPAGNSIRQEMKYGADDYSTQEQRDKDSEKYLASYPGAGSENTTPMMVQNFGGNLANMDKVAKNQKLNNGLSGIGNSVGKFGSVGQRLFCPINVTPFVPYYLSGADGVMWRSGYPITDANHSSKILNPLSSHKIGKNSGKIFELWANIYPREGTVNHEWDAKVGTVIAVRAASILNENKSIRVVNKPGNSNNGFGGWGKIFPVVGDTTPGASKSACHKNPVNTGITLNESGGYAWNYWRRYNCDLRTTGIYITTVKFPSPICLTKKVPQ